MLNLTSTTDKISLITGSAADIDSHVAWVEHPSPFTTSSSATPGNQNVAITTATTTDICAVPSGGSITKNVKKINIRNKDSADSTQVTVQYNANGTLYQLVSCLLLAGEELVMTDQGVWFHYDSNGGVYGQALPTASDTVVGGIEIATQAEIESASDITLAVTPGRMQFHPGVAKFWVKTKPGNVNSASHNVTSVSDTSAGITVITIATDFSGVDWVCQATIESTSDTMTVTNLKFCRIGLGDQAAGTVNIEAHDGTATTAVLEDPTSWHAVGYGDQA